VQVVPASVRRVVNFVLEGRQSLGVPLLERMVGFTLAHDNCREQAITLTDPPAVG